MLDSTFPSTRFYRYFFEYNGYEQLHAIGYVENIQAKNVASLRTIRVFEALPDGLDLGRAAIVKTTLPYRVFEEPQQ